VHLRHKYHHIWFPCLLSSNVLYIHQVLYVQTSMNIHSTTPACKLPPALIPQRMANKYPAGPSHWSMWWHDVGRQADQDALTRNAMTGVKHDREALCANKSRTYHVAKQSFHKSCYFQLRPVLPLALSHAGSEGYQYVVIEDYFHDSSQNVGKRAGPDFRFTETLWSTRYKERQRQTLSHKGCTRLKSVPVTL